MSQRVTQTSKVYPKVEPPDTKVVVQAVGMTLRELNRGNPEASLAVDESPAEIESFNVSSISPDKQADLPIMSPNMGDAYIQIAPASDCI